jgi:hypothetical protein
MPRNSIQIIDLKYASVASLLSRTPREFRRPTMKTISILSFVVAAFLVNGCSSTFLADYVQSSAKDEDPDAHWYDDPWFQDPVEYSQPANNNTAVAPDVQPLRNAGYVRRDSNNPGTDNSRSTGAVRTSNNSSPQVRTQTNSTVNVPTRGNNGTPTGAAQKDAKGNATQDRSGRR